jgi:hypothetical protein
VSACRLPIGVRFARFFNTIRKSLLNGIFTQSTVKKAVIYNPKTYISGLLLYIRAIDNPQIFGCNPQPTAGFPKNSG